MREPYGERRGSIFQYLLVLALVGASFWTGTLYKELALRRNGALGTTQIAGTQVENNGEPTIEKQLVLEGDEWKQLLEKPAVTLGNENAKVVMVEFFDYQCPFCKRAFEQTWPQIKKDYVDTGKIWYVMRDLPLNFHPNAKPGALAARCAGEQDKYLEMHDVLFTKQDEWVNVSDPQDKFVAYAKELGLNVGKFTNCYEDKKYEQAIDDDLALSSKVGATGTPTFYINGKQVVGAQPISAFTDVIEEELKK